MWVNPLTLDVYKLHSEIRHAFRSVSFPSDMSEKDISSVGLLPVEMTPAPPVDYTKNCNEAPPALKDGKWVQSWIVTEASADEVVERKLAMRRKIMDGVQRYLDDFARTKTYDSMLSACTYATSTVPQFAKEGQYCVEKRDECWAILARIEAEVLAGTRPAPTGFNDIWAELPALEWPQ